MSLPSTWESMLFWFLGALSFLHQICKHLLWHGSFAKKTEQNDLGKVPGPMILPFIGTRWIYYWRYSTLKVHDAYFDMARRYGAVIREVIAGDVNVVSLTNKNDIEQVLRYPSKYPFRPPSEILQKYRKSQPDKYASAGIAHEQGEVWFHLRSKLTPELTSRKIMLGFLPELNVIGDDFLQLLRYNRNSDGKVCEFQNFAARYGLETCCTLVLGQRMSFMENEITETAQKLRIAMNQRFVAERDSFYQADLEKYMKTPAYQNFLESENTLYSIISEIVENGEKNVTQNQYSDVKSILLSIVGKPDLDEREKKSALIDFVAAGISTLSHSLMFLMYLLSKYPETQKKIYDELELIAPNSNHITADDISKMAYTKACMYESFRLLPVAFALTRVLEEATVLGGYRLPAGCIVMCHTRLACQNEENFYSAKEFIPERWLEESKQCQTAAASIFAPFGMGRRMCPGKRFIEQAMLVTIAKIIREYVIDYESELDVQFEFVLSPKSPVSIRLRERC